MNAPLRIPLFFLALLCAATLHAKDPADYRAGDIADRDLVAPAAFDAVNAEATAEKKSVEAKKIPAVFRDLFATTTNVVARDFFSAFAAARADFQAAVKKQFRTTKLWDRTIASKTFNDFVSRYNSPGQNFPVPASLAAEWARGKNGTEIQDQLLSRLLQILQTPVCPENLPENFSTGETVRLIPVNSPDESISPGSISTSGRLIATTNLLTIARAQILLRESFPPDEQSLAAALADILKPNCFPDAALTQQVRERAVQNLTATIHIAAGQIVVPRGAVIDEKALAVLAQMPRPKISSPSQNNLAGENSSRAATSIFTRDFLLVTALVVVSLIAAIALMLVWRLSRARSVESQLPARLPSAASFSPQIAEVIKAALVQELAATRVELLKAQQSFSTKNISPNGHESKNGATTGADDQNNFVQNLVHEGQSRLSMNELEAALKCFDTAVTLQPRDAETLVKMGGVLEKLDRTEEAFTCYDRAIAADGTLTIAYLQKGGLLNRLARYAEATQCYEKALTNQDKNSPKNSRA